eukprot:gb/GECG01006927.1/.p1 GENE.gb/GECG01006927.1/~~gb/GECG01006927.1/.p1  ORF type:complete len:231 (+),score=41.02 gb/GECG01006927.1/:1-693(+)
MERQHEGKEMEDQDLGGEEHSTRTSHQLQYTPEVLHQFNNSPDAITMRKRAREKQKLGRKSDIRKCEARVQELSKAEEDLQEKYKMNTGNGEQPVDMNLLRKAIIYSTPLTFLTDMTSLRDYKDVMNRTVEVAIQFLEVREKLEASRVKATNKKLRPAKIREEIRRQKELIVAIKKMYDDSNVLKLWENRTGHSVSKCLYVKYYHTNKGIEECVDSSSGLKNITGPFEEE